MSETTATAAPEAGGIVIPTNAEIDVIGRERDLPPQRLVEQEAAIARKARPERPKDHNGKVIGNPNHSGFILWHTIPKGRKAGQQQRQQVMVLGEPDIDPKEMVELMQQQNPGHYGKDVQADHVENFKGDHPLSALANLAATPDVEKFRDGEPK